ncbi:MAG: lamin tail domain-containing protein [Candidatus Shapirobacteria bacterium]
MIIFLFVICLFLVPKIAHAQVSISEISPVTNPEWVEIYNASDSAVMLNGWKFDDIESDGESPKDLSSINIQALSYYIIDLGNGYLNNGGDSARLINNLGSQVDIFTYSTSNSELNWSKQPNGNWCQATPSKDNSNNSCFTPTSTPTPTTVIVPSSTPTPSNAPTPTSTPTITTTLTPTPAPSTTSTPTPTSGPIHITIDNISSSASLGSTFTIRFIVNHAKPNTDFYIKAYGGINDDNYCLETQNGSSWYGFNSAWDNLPKFRSNNDGYISNLLFVRSKTDKEIGNYKVKVKIRDPETESEIKYITITKFVPSPTPTLVPTPTVEPTPTESFEEPTPGPLPTDTPEAIPDSVNILGLSDAKGLSPTISPPQDSKSKRGIIPVIFISVGAVFLLIPLLVSKIRGVQ